MKPDFQVDERYVHRMDVPVKIPKPPWKPKFSNVAYWSKNLSPPADVGVPGDVWGIEDPPEGPPSMFLRSVNEWVAIPDGSLVANGMQHPLADYLTLCFDTPDRIVWAAQTTALQMRRKYVTAKPTEAISDYTKVTCAAFTKLRYQLVVATWDATSPPSKSYPDVQAARKDNRGPSVRKRLSSRQLESARKRSRLSEDADGPEASSDAPKTDNESDGMLPMQPLSSKPLYYYL